MNKLEVRWRDGIFLGVRETTGEYLIGTSDGVVKARALKEKPPSEQYEWKQMEAMVGLPWQPTPKDPTITDVPTVIMEPSAHVPIPAPPVQDGPVPRQLYINKGMLTKYGYTGGCPGCDAARAGKRAVAHNQICRDRISAELEKTESGKKRIKDVTDKFTDYIVEKEEQKEKKRRVEEKPAGDGLSLIHI